MNNMRQIGGSRVKNTVLDIKNDRLAIFKLVRKPEESSEDCSEKMACEIARVLGYRAADIELAEDAIGRPGILSYLFVNIRKNVEHMEAKSFLVVEGNEIKQSDYCISNVKRRIDTYSEELFPQFIKMIVLDSLVGKRIVMKKTGAFYLIMVSMSFLRSMIPPVVF